MKKIFAGFLIFLLLSASCANAETLSTYQILGDYPAFFDANPNVTVNVSPEYYENTDILLSALLTGTFQNDLFRLSTYIYDVRQIMRKGYCAEITSEKLKNMLAQMHPAIQAQCMIDGKVYALPTSLFLDYLRTDEFGGWEQAGFTKKDFPKSFPHFLTFLESWIARQEKDPDPTIKVLNYWDETVYTETAYTTWLVELLIKSCIAQQAYLGETVDFNSPALPEMLERCMTIGKRLYEIESKLPAAYGLFEMVTRPVWPEDAQGTMVNLRFSDEAPMLLDAYLDVVLISPDCQNQPLAEAYLECMMDDLSKDDQVFLYTNAQPLPDKNYEDNIASFSGWINKAKSRLEDSSVRVGDAELDSYNERELLDFIAMEEQNISYSESHRWIMSPEALDAYQTAAQTLYFPMPNAFSVNTPQGQSMWALEKRYAAGSMTCDEFLIQMNRLAQMVALESEE